VTTYTLSPYPIQKFFDNSGAPLAYGQLTTWEAGTTTPIATYSNYAGAVNTNPIILNARGECSLWLLPNVAYKLSLTDANGNLIPGYPVDQLINSQLLTLYGGVDFGSPNAYEITYSAPYTSYTAGNPVIYFIASNSNTGPSTINVNGLGIVPIVNPNGSPLTAGQIVNNQMVQIVWQNGQFILTSIGATTGLNIGTFGAEASIAAANVTDLGSTGSHTINVTGSSVITSLGTSASINAPIFMVRFSGTNTLTYNATSLITPLGVNINVNTGDAMLAEYLGSGNWKILIYQGTLNTSQYVARTTQGTATSSTAITIDTQLQLSLTATGTYIVQGWINDAGGTSSGGLSGGIYYSGSLLNGYWSSNGVGTSVTTVPLTAIGTAAEMQSAQTGVGSMPIIGMIQATSTGTLSFNWAQHSSNATASVVSPGSYLEATYVTNMAGGFIPVTYSFNTAGSFTFTIPTGATTLTLEAWGPSGAGSTAGGGGGGGGSGGYCKTIITVSGDGGETINYTVGILGTTSSAATNSTVTSGTFSLTTITAGAGGNASGSTAGAAGTATGGTTTNTAGNAGVAGGSGGTGGAPIFGTYGVGQPGGQGLPTPYPAFPGGNGLVVFHFA
jgi:hypothetical protein